MKKLLALVLALVMTLGLATVSSSAADYSDANSISYKEAVDVMSAVGVLQGDNGAFNPTGALTREQGAKIIAYMLLGTTAADALKAPKAPFSDVAADRWSAGAIAYCVAEGIIAGVGNNQFNPTGELTGYAFAKMALTALGYNAKSEGLVGSDWQINTAKNAMAAGLLKDIETLPMGLVITREQAAQVGFNTLKANMVRYENQMTVTGTDVQVTTTGLRDTYDQTASADYRYPTLAPAGDGVLQLVEKTFPNLKKVAATGDFGESGYKWTFDNAEVDTYSDSATFTYSAKMRKDDGTANSTLSAALNGYTIAAGGWTAHVNGITTNVAVFDSLTGNDTDGSDLPFFTGNGHVVEIYATNRQVTNVVAKIYDLYEVNSKTDSAVYLVKKTSNSLGGTVAFANTNSLEVTKTNDNKDYFDQLSALNKGEWAMLATNGTGGEIVGTEAFTTVSGLCSEKATDGKYVVAGNSYKTAVGSVAPTVGNEFNVVLDPYNYLVYSKEAEEVSKQYALVLGGYLDGNAAAGYKAVARLLTAEGKVVLAQVKKVNNVSLSKDSDLDYYFGNTAGIFNTTAGYGDTAGSGDLLIVKYSVDADKQYTLYTVADQAAAAAGGTDSVKSSDTSFTPDGTAVKTLNSKTVFVAQTGSSAYTAFTGVKNIATITAAGGASTNNTYIAWTGSTADAIFFVRDGSTPIKYATLAGSGVSYLVFYKSGYGINKVDGDDVYTFTVIKDGIANSTVQTKMAWDALAGDTGAGSTHWYYGVFMNPIYDSDGYLVSATQIMESDNDFVSTGLPVGLVDFTVASSTTNADAFINSDSILTLESSNNTIKVGNGIDGTAGGATVAADYTAKVADNFVAYKITKASDSLSYENLNSSALLELANGKYMFTADSDGLISAMYYFA